VPICVWSCTVTAVVLTRCSALEQVRGIVNSRLVLSDLAVAQDDASDRRGVVVAPRRATRDLTAPSGWVRLAVYRQKRRHPSIAASTFQVVFVHALGELRAA
jgi:hypothetical protein